MCIVNSNEGKFEVIIKDLNNEVIVSFRIKSITLACRLLDEFDFRKARISIIKLSDNTELNVFDLLDTWRNAYE